MIIGGYQEDAWLHQIMEVQRLLEKSQACMAELSCALRVMGEPIGKCLEEDPHFMSQDVLQRFMEIHAMLEEPERVIQEMKMQADEAEARYRDLIAQYAKIDQEAADMFR